uniref:Uncharacterized protein n=1 Tax=Arundo donax TaxID=35708 RepID=A0A0A8ZJI9_ARUDO
MPTEVTRTRLSTCPDRSTMATPRSSLSRKVVAKRGSVWRDLCAAAKCRSEVSVSQHRKSARRRQRFLAGTCNKTSNSVLGGSAPEVETDVAETTSRRGHGQEREEAW